MPPHGDVGEMSNALRKEQSAPGERTEVSTVPGERPEHACVGAILGGRYLVKRVIGEGGMGTVYEGEHTGLARPVAIKLMHASFAAQRDLVERFRREAQSASALENPHIVDVLDVGTDERFGLYMVMELLRGTDVAGALAQHGRFSPEIAFALGSQAAFALGTTHAAGIIHRDIKPANLFLVQRADGSVLVKLLDFSIAKVVHDVTTTHGGHITRAGSALGTPQYMAPEQAQGGKVDQRIDIYALGAVLFELIAGKPAREPKPTYELMIVDVIMRPAPRLRSVLPTVPQPVDTLIARMMAQDPAHRPADMDEVLGAFAELFPELEHARLMLEDDTGAPYSLRLDSAGAGADVFSRAKPAHYLSHMPFDERVGASPDSLLGAGPRRPRLKWSLVAGLGVAALMVGAVVGAVALLSSANGSDPAGDPMAAPATESPAASTGSSGEPAAPPGSTPPVGAPPARSGETVAPTASTPASTTPSTQPPQGTRPADALPVQRGKGQPRNPDGRQVGGTGVAEKF